MTRLSKAKKRDFLARLEPAKLNYNPGPWLHTKFKKPTKKARRNRILHNERFFAPQKYLDYYGMFVEERIDEWEIELRWGQYFGRCDKTGKIVNYKAKVKKNDRHRRLRRRDNKLDRIEARLI